VVTYRSISDPKEFAAYAELALPAVMRFGARILARGNAVVAREHGLKERTVVTEFPSLEKAPAAYDSAAYAEALKALGGGAVRDFRSLRLYPRGYQPNIRHELAAENCRIKKLWPRAARLSLTRSNRRSRGVTSTDAKAARDRTYCLASILNSGFK
jgi:uncharacterized protein (DUF1330 family)